MSSRTWLFATLVGLMLVVPAVPALGDAFVTGTILGRIYDPSYGTDVFPNANPAPFLPVLGVQENDIVEFVVLAKMADLGTTNTDLYGQATTITSLVPSTDPNHPNGIHSLKFNLYQVVDAPIQTTMEEWGLNVDPSGPWTGTGTAVGTLLARGATGKDDLVNVVAMGLPGGFVGVPNLLPVYVGVGWADVNPGSIAGHNVRAKIEGSYELPVPIGDGTNPHEIAVAVAVNGDTQLVGVVGQQDPMLKFEGLTLYDKFLNNVRAKLGADAGGGVYTADYTKGGYQLSGSASYNDLAKDVSYSWDLDGDGQYDDAFGADPDIPAAVLLGMGEAEHTISLKVEADGLVGTDSATLNITPEPATLALLAMGLIGFALRGRRSR